jgi:hypothetical protein
MKQRMALVGSQKMPCSSHASRDVEILIFGAEQSFCFDFRELRPP